MKKTFLCLHDAMICVDQISIVETLYDEDDQPAIRITYGNRSEIDYYQDYFETEEERDRQFDHIINDLKDLIDEHGKRVYLHMPDALIRISMILAVYKYDQEKDFAINIELANVYSDDDYWYYYDTENERDQDFERIKNDIMAEGFFVSGFYVADGIETIKDGKPMFERRPITECLVEESGQQMKQ